MANTGEKADDTALVISKYGLDARRFDAKSNNWEISEIRQWLNNEFYNGTFKDEEKNAILEYREAGCKVFLLSEEEAGKYFKNNEDRKACPTPYAKGRGAYTNDDRGGSCWWWLRLPRRKSFLPSSFSRSFICFERAGCETYRLSAAEVILPFLATSRKYLSTLSSIFF